MHRSFRAAAFTVPLVLAYVIMRGKLQSTLTQLIALLLCVLLVSGSMGLDRD